MSVTKDRPQPGPGAPLTAEREQYRRLMAQAMNNHQGCLQIGVHPTTGMRWRKGRNMVDHKAKPAITRRYTLSRRTRGATGIQQDRSAIAEYQFLREWRTALALVQRERSPGSDRAGRADAAAGTGEAATNSGSRYIAFGSRSLDLASGIDHTTVAAHLRRLRDEPDPLVELIEGDRDCWATRKSRGSPTASPPAPAGPTGRPAKPIRFGRCSAIWGCPPRSSTKRWSRPRRHRAASTWPREVGMARSRRVRGAGDPCRV